MSGWLIFETVRGDGGEGWAGGSRLAKWHPTDSAGAWVMDVLIDPSAGLSPHFSSSFLPSSSSRLPSAAPLPMCP